MLCEWHLAIPPGGTQKPLPRGHFSKMRIADRTAPGVLVAEGLYWPRFMPKNHGVNELTSQALTDMGQDCALHCNLVEVTPAHPADQS